MAKEFAVSFINRHYTKLYPEGICIGDILKAENFPLAFICNGQGKCGKCRVKIAGATSAPTAIEQKHISIEGIALGERLACQVYLTGPVTLEISEDKEFQNILLDGRFVLDRLNPLWGRLTVSKPAVLSWEALSKGLSGKYTPEIAALRALALLPANSNEVTIEYFGTRVINVSNAAAKTDKLGVAVDIGTTTLAAYLIDFSKGAILRTATSFNPQISYGTDVISRINYAKDNNGLTRLQEMIVSAINQLIAELTAGQGTTSDDIIQVNLVGNSCMMHLLLGISPIGLGQLPFEPVIKNMLDLDPAELGVKINSQGRVFILPGIGGFIGSDISAGVLACNLNSARQELFIDIGTNGELILTGQGKMLASSTAAGPAFEGASIACGMQAKSGAITDLKITVDSVEVTTINGGTPLGICGTGLIRTLVELIRKGFITKSGRWADGINHPYFDPKQQLFFLVKDDFRPVYLTQNDIRQFQLAKGAIRTGVELLLKRLSIQADKLEVFYLAGAFGSYLNPADAIFLGLLPEVALDRVRGVGNTAGTGAVISILSQTALTDLATTVSSIEHVELAEDPQFTEVFTNALLLGNANAS